MKILKRSRSIQEILPIERIEDNLLLLKDGRVAAGFSLELEEMEKKPEAGLRYESRVLQSLLNALPIGAVLQKIDIYYHEPFRIEKSKGNKKGYFEQKAINHFYNRLLLKHRSYIFISIGKDEQPRANPVNSLFAFGRSIGKNPFVGLEKRLEKITRLSSELMASISSLGLGIKRMGDGELDGLYKDYFSLSFGSGRRGYERSITRSKRSMTLGEKQVKLINLIGQGALADSVMLNGGVASDFVFPLMQHLAIPHILSSSIRIENREKELKALDLDKKLNSSLDFLAGQDNDIKSVEIDEFTAGVRAKNEQLVSLNVSVILWSANPDLLESYVEQTLSGFRMLSGAKGWVETLDSSNLFFAAAPGNSFQGYRWLLMKAENALCYMSLSGNYKSDSQGIRLSDRFRNPLRVNLFNTDLNNQNALVIGPSGSGKSFTIGSFIIQRHEKQHRQIIIDNGGTYKNAMTALEGKYFEYDPEHPLSFNPFLLPKDERGKEHLSGDKLTFLISLLATLWKGGGKLSQPERSILSLLIPKFYAEMGKGKQEQMLRKQKGLRKLKLADFYYWLEELVYERVGEELERMEESFDFKQFLITLKPFVEGEYKEVLNAEIDMDISEYPLLAFDMAKVKSNLLLYPIIALLITELALDQIRAFPDQRKYIYMDEAWSMLSDSMGEFVENMYRTVRKNNGSMCIITQGITEITSSSVGAAIIANADTQIILNHSDKTRVQKLGDTLGFTGHELAKINSIRASKDYRELFIKQGEYGKVYLLEVSDHMMAVLSSKPKERNALTKLIAKKARVTHALDQFVENKLSNAGGSRG